MGVLIPRVSLRCTRGYQTSPRPGLKTIAVRIRVGSYRVIYEIHDDKPIVLIIAIGDRKEIYR